MKPIADAWCTVEETGGRLLVRWGGEGFEEVKADFRRAFPRHRDAVYLPTERAWSVPASHRRLLELWSEAWFYADAVTWERPSSGRAEAPPHPAQALTTVDAAARVLCLTPEAPPELVETARRWWAKRVHPDVGGDEDAMRAVNAAADALLAAHK